MVHLFGPEDPVVAQIDGQPLLLSELESGLRATVIRTLFDLDRRLADEVENHVMETILEREAAAAGMTLDGWIDWKIDERVWPVTLSEAKQHFRTAGFPQGTQFGQVREQIIAQLTTQRRAGARVAVLEEVRARHQVDVILEPFRLDLASNDDPALGPAGAPVTIMEFSDFQCLYCAKARVTVKELINRYPNRVRLVARDFPLAMHGLAAAVRPSRADTGPTPTPCSSVIAPSSRRTCRSSPGSWASIPSPSRSAWTADTTPTRWPRTCRRARSPG